MNSPSTKRVQRRREADGLSRLEFSFRGMQLELTLGVSRREGTDCFAQ